MREIMIIYEASEFDLFKTIGVIGFVLYMGAFAALQAGILSGSSALFTILNILAACCVLVSLTVDFNLSSALIQLSWIVIGFFGLVRRALIKSNFVVVENKYSSD